MKSIKQLICLICLVCLTLPMLAQAVGPAKVRVGYYEYTNFMEASSSGIPTGFASEYLYGVSKYTGWIYDYIDCGSWEQAAQMLAAGEIDLLPGIYQNSDRAEFALYPSFPMCNISASLYTRSTDERAAFEDFVAFEGMRVALIQGSTDAAQFLAYAAENGFTVQPIYYATTQEARTALAGGDVDALAITHLGRGTDLRCVAQFSSAPIYMGVSPARPDLLDQLDRGLNTLRLQDYDFESQLYGKYFSAGAEQTPVFTRQELAYIQKAEPIVAVYDETWAPLSYTDPDTGAFSGLAADFFEHIERYTGLSFSFLPAQNNTRCLELSQRTDIDLVCTMPNSYLSSVENRLLSTQYYIDAPVALVSRNGQRKFERFAALKGYLGDQFSATMGQEGNITYLNTPEDCFDALLAGQVDGVYLNHFVADYQLANRKYQDLSVVTLTDYRQELCIGVSDSAKPELFSILNKCIQYIAMEQIDQLILKNTIAVQELTVQDILQRYPVAILSSVIGFFSLLVLSLVFLLRLKSRSKDNIERLLYLDGVTGQWNLTKFRLEVEKRIQGAPAGSYALVYVDIKQFHTINDRCGFSEGDRILRALGSILLSVLGEGEHCARVSADHFVLLLGYEHPRLLFERLDAIDRQLSAWVQREHKTYRLVLACGAYIADEIEGGDLNLMMDLANYARRSIANTHKSRVVLYDAEMRKTALNQRELSDRMQPALENGEFLVYYQPKVDMRTGRLVGSEALVRWNYPGRGILLPGAFIPYFEQTGFVVDLDLYVFEQVCRFLRDQMTLGRTILPVSCNFSTLHISEFHFARQLAEIADRYGIPHRYLELEVTESVFIRDLEEFSRHFHLLKGMDFPISIDDFGSGYSSLGLLQRFPVDVVKLDRSFIQQGIRSAREQAVLRGIISMAGDLNVALVCEGVETLDQANILCQLGCSVAQGWYYARPVTVLEFESMLECGYVNPAGDVPAELVDG